MAQADYDFEYSWEDLKPVRPLFVTILVVQTLGILAGVVFGHGGVWAERAFVWGSMATFIGYLLGLWVQAVTMPGSLERNRVLVRHLGLVSAFFGIFSLFFDVFD